MQFASSQPAIIGLAVAVFVGTVGLAQPAPAFTPESPEVREAVDKAIRFLESGAKRDENSFFGGGQALVGMALLKHGAEPTHPKVVEAVEAIQENVKANDPRLVSFDIYSTGICAIFLIELDPGIYATEIQCLIDSLVLRQKEHGGWGYSHLSTGDSSMTQYGVLCLWEATQAGFKVPQKTIESVAMWLLKTQDPSGAFGYQGQVSPTFTPVEQTQIRISMVGASMGGLYICADLLGLTTADQRAADDGVPMALKEIREPKQPRPVDPRAPFDPEYLRLAVARGNQWMAVNYVIDPPSWQHYYLYALERYMSFRELADGRSPKNMGKAANWYDDGVRDLLATQKEDGSWKGSLGPVVDTSFSALFLMRSTKKRIQKIRNFGEGVAIGGRGLPPSTDDLLIRRGQVVARPLLGPAEELLAALENPDGAEYDRAVSLLAGLSTEQAKDLVGTQANRLAELAKGSSVEARVAAVRALGRSRDLQNVPTLIYALADADVRVMAAARDALRRVSRRPKGYGLSDRPSGGELQNVINHWKAWYLAVRPDAEFEE